MISRKDIAKLKENERRHNINAHLFEAQRVSIGIGKNQFIGVNEGSRYHQHVVAHLWAVLNYYEDPAVEYWINECVFAVGEILTDALIERRRRTMPYLGEEAKQ